MRLASLSALSLALVWLVLTKSLPFALAPSAPDRALALNPNNPAALIAKARQIRARLLALSTTPPEAAGGGTSSGHANTIARLPEPKNGGSRPEPAGEREALRNEIAALATRALANDPLNAEAFRLLAETVDDPGRARVLMQDAVKHSRREGVALFWLLNDSFYRKDYQSALSYADIMLRTRPELTKYILNYVSLIAEDPEGLSLLVKVLAKGPKWREQFLESFPGSMRQIDTPLKLMAGLKESGSPPSSKELAPYLDVLIGKNRVDAAYNAWLQFLPAPELANVRLLTNGNFESSPSGLPFDWRIAPGLNSVAELVAPASDGRGRFLHMSFGSGRVKFPELSQIVLLGPGRYRLEGQLRGRIVAKRGLRWQLACATGSRQVLAQTDMLLGETQQWRVFTLEAVVPEGQDCVGQALRLFHDSRSASEEFISGEIWFGGLHLERIQDAKQVAK